MDLIKGLENGFFHTWETGGSAHRLSVFKRNFKKHVDSGKFIRDIQNAPRDARYKIDHYYRGDVKQVDTVPYPYLNFYEDELEFLDINEEFNWTDRLKSIKGEYINGDFTIGYGEYDFEMWDGEMSTRSGYYFKYKGKINDLIFNYGPELVDYSDRFWKEYEGKAQYYDEVDKLLHNIGYFIGYKGIKIKFQKQ